MTSRFGRSLSLLSVALLLFLLAGCGSKDGEIHDVPIGVNLVENGSFEAWRRDEPIGWELELVEGEGDNPLYFGKSVEEKNTGSYSFYMRGIYNTDKWYVLTQRIPILPENHITFSAAMMSKGLKSIKGMEKRANIFLRYFDKDGNRLPHSRLYGDVRINAYVPLAAGLGNDELVEDIRNHPGSR